MMKKALIITFIPSVAIARCGRYPPEGWPLSNPVCRTNAPAKLGVQATLGVQESSSLSRRWRPLFPNGDVTVKEGVEYEIEASGTVRLEDGFKVEKGATFAVYPSCF